MQIERIADAMGEDIAQVAEQVRHHVGENMAVVRRL